MQVMSGFWRFSVTRGKSILNLLATRRILVLLMKVIRAKSSGFCWGVERAIQVAREQAEGGNRKVYTDGPLIHNNQMMNALGREGVSEVSDYHSSSAIDCRRRSETIP